MSPQKWKIFSKSREMNTKNHYPSDSNTKKMRITLASYTAYLFNNFDWVHLNLNFYVINSYIFYTNKLSLKVYLTQRGFETDI